VAQPRRHSRIAVAGCSPATLFPPGSIRSKTARDRTLPAGTIRSVVHPPASRAARRPWPSRRAFLRRSGLGLGAVLLGCRARPPQHPRRVLLVAGADSHGYGTHAHHAGCALLADRLSAVDGVRATVRRDDWADDERALDGTDAVVFYGDGGADHPAASRADLVDALARRGVGIGFLHYALVPPDERWYPRMRAWIGGHYEPGWSVNPTWRARFAALPDHPVTRGVRPFAIEDEWYYHMRFRPGLDGVVPLLTAVPPDATRQGPHGPHSGNPQVATALGQAEHLAWVATRDGGGRGFGFTGGHDHWSWAHDDYRRLVLNAILWLAQAEIPAGGCPSRRPTLAELLAPLGAPPAGFDRDALARRIAAWSQAEGEAVGDGDRDQEERR
jgi:type 1 glutamine amidotransferase